MYRFVLVFLVAVFVLNSAVCAKSSKPVKIRMLVTAYCPCTVCCGPEARGITASGKPVSANGGKFCAAPKNYKFGAMISIPGYNDGKPIPVYDRGGAIKGNHIDLYFPTHAEARKWGKRWIVVTVWK